MEKLIRENREKLPDADVKTAEEALESAKRALADANLERMKSANEALERAAHKLAEVLYRAGAGPAAGASAASQPSPGATPSGQAPGSGEVIDAEYVDVDESKKPN